MVAAQGGHTLVGPWLRHEEVILAFSYSGLWLDLLAVPALLWPRSRLWAFGVLGLFHFMNARLFAIGVFPWLMVALTALFLPANWPRRLLAEVWPRPSASTGRVLWASCGFALVGVLFIGRFESPALLAGGILGALLAWHWCLPNSSAATKVTEPTCQVASRLAWPAFGAVVVWALLQVSLPLRHHAIPGDVAWTTEGERFSWHMKLNDRDGRMRFIVQDPDEGRRLSVDPREVLPSWQVNRMDGRPSMMRQFAQHLARQHRRLRGGPVVVHVHASLSLNNAPLTMQVDPDVDLSRARASFLGSAPWILRRRRWPGLAAPR